MTHYEYMELEQHWQMTISIYNQYKKRWYRGSYRLTKHLKLGAQNGEYLAF